MRSKTALLCVAVLLLAAVGAYAQQPFPDTPENHWAYQAVTQLQSEGIVAGYPDGYFRGGRNLTRYEFAQALFKAMERMRATAAPTDLEARVSALEGRAPGGAAMTAEQTALLQRLQTEFAPELAKLRADHDALERRVAALEQWRSRTEARPGPVISDGEIVPAPRLAYPTLAGPTGGAVLPNAMVMPAGRLAIAADFTEVEASNLGSYLNDDISILPVRLVYGLGGRAEIWGSWTRFDNSNDADGWGAGLKVQLMKESERGFSLAVGGGFNRLNDLANVIGFYTTDDEFDFWNAYLVASKRFGSISSRVQMTGSLGAMFIDVDELIPGEEILQPFVGLDFVFGRGTTLGLEYRFEDKDVDANGLFSAVLRHPFSRNLALQVGVTNGAFAGIGSDDYDVFGGLAFTFGGNYD